MKPIIIKECEAYGLTFDDVIMGNNDAAFFLESQVCKQHYEALPPEEKVGGAYIGEYTHEVCGVKECFREAYAQIYLR